jgi:hypothetical protein
MDAGAISNRSSDWWRFPFDLGRKLASLEIFDRKIKCAILMPIVDYAASFLAAGLLIGHAEARLNSRGQQDCSDKFEKLKKLPKNTKLLVCFNDLLIVGRTKGCARDPVLGSDAVNVEYKIRNEYITDPYSPRMATKLFFIPPYVEELLSKHVDFLSELTGFSAFMEEDSRLLAELITAPIEQIVICGDKNQIHDEAKSDFELPNGVGPYPIGRFNNVLQIEGINGTVHPWIRCVSTLEQRNWKDELSRPVMIFRGSRAFLRHSQNMTDGSWIAIIGANDTRMRDAVNQFNSMFVERAGDLEKEDWPEPMRGAELMGFVS